MGVLLLASMAKRRTAPLRRMRQKGDSSTVPPSSLPMSRFCGFERQQMYAPAQSSGHALSALSMSS